MAACTPEKCADLGLTLTCVPMFSDNQACIKIINVEHIGTESQKADILTKALGGKALSEARMKLHITSISYYQM
jgi:hypothetical protein